VEVLFTLLAERYERGSVMVTSNLPFSKWESIFKDPLTTAAAIDRPGAPQRHLGLTPAELPVRGSESVQGGDKRRVIVPAEGKRWGRWWIGARWGGRNSSRPKSGLLPFRPPHRKKEKQPGILIVAKAEE